MRGHLGLGVELRVEEAAEDVLAQARAAVQRPRGVVSLRVHLVLGGGGWRVEAGWWLGLTRSQAGDGSAECHLAAGRCCLAAWPAMVTKLVPDNIHPSYQLMGSGHNTHNKWTESVYLHTVET